MTRHADLLLHFGFVPVPANDRIGQTVFELPPPTREERLEHLKSDVYYAPNPVPNYLLVTPNEIFPGGLVVVNDEADGQWMIRPECPEELYAIRDALVSAGMSTVWTRKSKWHPEEN